MPLFTSVIIMPGLSLTAAVLIGVIIGLISVLVLKVGVSLIAGVLLGIVGSIIGNIFIAHIGVSGFGLVQQFFAGVTGAFLVYFITRMIVTWNIDPNQD